MKEYIMEMIKNRHCPHIKYLTKQNLNQIIQRPLDQVCSFHQSNQIYYLCLHCGASCCLGYEQDLNCLQFHFRQSQHHYFSVQIDLGTIWCTQCKDSIQNILFTYDDKDKGQHFSKMDRFVKFVSSIWQQIAPKIKTIKQIKMLRGIKNLGNTCFLNVVLQTLNATEPLKTLYSKFQKAETRLKFHSRFIDKQIELFYDQILEKKQSENWNVVKSKKEMSNKNQKMLKKREVKTAQFNFLLQQFFGQMNQSGQTAFKPYEFFQYLGETNSKYKLHQEQDAEQLFLKILELLTQGERFSLLSDKQRYSEVESMLGFQKLAPIESVFGFYLLNQIQCNQCKETTHNINLTYHLPITLETSKPEDYTIQHKDNKIDVDYWQELHYPLQSQTSCFLSNFFKVQKLSLLNNFYSCSKCKSLLAYRKYYIVDQPQVLVVSIKRFNSQFQKNSKHVQFPVNFDLKQFTTSPNPKKYTLYGVIVHEGKGISCGHYTCLVKYSGRWFLCSDHRVQIVEERYVLSQQAYILFYQSQQNDV